MSFTEQVQEERTRLETRKQELETELAEIKKELAALDAYLKTKTGTTPRRKQGIRKTVLAAVQERPGITRAALLEHHKATDTRSTRSVDNAIAALVKAGKITKTDDGYTVT